MLLLLLYRNFTLYSQGSINKFDILELTMHKSVDERVQRWRDRLMYLKNFTSNHSLDPKILIIWIQDGIRIYSGKFFILFIPHARTFLEAVKCLFSMMAQILKYCIEGFVKISLPVVIFYLFSTKDDGTARNNIKMLMEKLHMKNWEKYTGISISVDWNIIDWRFSMASEIHSFSSWWKCRLKKIIAVEIFS